MSVRIASGVLIASTAAAVVGCASATERPTTLAPTAAASEHPSETLTSLIHQALPNIQGEALTSATVTLPPAARAVPTDTATRSSMPTCSKALCAASSKANRCAHTTKARTGSSSQEPTTWPRRRQQHRTSRAPPRRCRAARPSANGGHGPARELRRNRAWRANRAAGRQRDSRRDPLQQQAG
jgi:hypothetical protein